MQTQNPASWKHSNRYNATAGCVFCQGVVRHEAWCHIENENTRYALNAVLHADSLSVADRISLHALGVAWT